MRNRLHATGPCSVDNIDNESMRNSMYSPQLQDVCSTRNAPKKSTLLEQEKRAIERFQEKQRKEIEKMIGYELKLNEIKRRNDEKA